MDVWNRQETFIKNGGLKTIFNLETKLIWITAKIESAGIGIDVDTLLELHDELTEKIDCLTAVLKNMMPADISLNDRSRIKAHLNSVYSLSLAEISDNSVKTISNAEARNLLNNLLVYWKTSRNLYGTESYMSLTGPDDRVRDSVDQLNTKTGRFYRMLQTVQKKGWLRSLFRAKEGYKFIVADYSQQEARIIAGLSNDRVAIDLFKAGKDLYLETAKIIMGSDVNTRWHRDLGKEIFLGLSNGRSAYSIYETLAHMGFGYDLDDVHGMILRYSMTFEGIQLWRDNIVSLALNSGDLSTKLGRRLKVSKDTKVNSLYNYPVQGTAADGFKRALIELNEQLEGMDATIVHILHDEMIVEARDDIADSVALTVRSCMEKAFRDILPEVPFVVEPIIRDSWG
jgi:DNA polymerase I-like protein with 3'-5' exonuclease and polymerase domains